MELTLHAPAKVNLTLIVDARRDDGYHDVSTVMQTVGLYDTLTLTGGGSGLTMTCTDPDLPTDGSNLVLRAAALFCRELHLPAPDLHLHLQKRIPSQAGLGGGSSDAAAVLRAMRTLYAPEVSDAELERMAARLGSDVPFFIRGGTALATGRGERLAPLPRLREGWFVIVKPPEGFSTPAMYRRLDELPPQPPQPDGMPAAGDRRCPHRSRRAVQQLRACRSAGQCRVGDPGGTAGAGRAGCHAQRQRQRRVRPVRPGGRRLRRRRCPAGALAADICGPACIKSENTVQNAGNSYIGRCFYA